MDLYEYMDMCEYMDVNMNMNMKMKINCFITSNVEFDQINRVVASEIMI